MWAGTRYQVLDPITHGNLTVWPVASGDVHDTSRFLTLDEGLRSGEVIVSEAGQISPLIRRRGMPLPPARGAEVNRLVLINNSKRPLLLLAGEIVTGGKQDRVVGADRIVPPESDPVDLSVFCVEPGRWTGTSDHFGKLSMQFAQPSVRKQAMAAKNQQQVWDTVNTANAVMAETITVESQAGAVGGAPSPGARPAPAATPSTTSYATMMDSRAVAQRVDEVAKPIQDSYSGMLAKLRDKKAVGVVVAVDGRIIWADIFASPSLLERYWPKLVRSYAAEAITTRVSTHGKLTNDDAQHFLDDLAGRREVVETEPGLYRHAEITGKDYTVFELTSLLPNTGFPVHIAKMGDSTASMTWKRPETHPWIR
jgi:hypothetical protein